MSPRVESIGAPLNVRFTVGPSHHTRRAGRIVPAGGRQHGLNGDLVFGVEGEIVLDREPAARAERQSLDVPPLRGPVFRRVANLGVAHRAIADRAAADLHRGLRVAFEQCRRYAERRRDVVEARDGYVLRQRCRERARIVRQKVADRVRVLGSVKRASGLAPGFGFSRPCRVEPLLDPARDAVEGRAIGALLAFRRHQPGAELADRGFPDGGVAAMSARSSFSNDVPPAKSTSLWQPAQ